MDFEAKRKTISHLCLLFSISFQTNPFIIIIIIFIIVIIIIGMS